jgi:hypothetical protein
MSHVRVPKGSAVKASHRWMSRTALTAVGMSIALMATVGIQGPSAVVVTFPAAPPLPPWYFHMHPSATEVSAVLWLAVLLGAGGLGLGLTAVRIGWRPHPRRLIIGSVLALMILLVIPPTGSADMMLYVVSGRITVLGHSPYIMTPQQLKSSGDPVGAIAVDSYPNDPTRYGPLATGLEAAASELAGTSVARAVFWLKVWNGLSYLVLVFLLDRVTRSDAAQRARVHLMWSLNPFMLWEVIAGGHNDVLAAALGVCALLALRGTGSLRAALAGTMLGFAAATKAQFVLFGTGLAWASRRSPQALGMLILGAGAVLVPSYLLVGRGAVSAAIGVAGDAPVGYTPWFAFARLAGLADTRIDALGLLGFAILVVVLLWRLPAGSPDFPAVRVALAFSLAWLIASPQERAWYFAMVFPLLAVIPASRLDWIVIVDGAAGAGAELPRLFGASRVSPAWAGSLVKVCYDGMVPVVLAVCCGALLWLCATNGWKPVTGKHRPLREGTAQP